MAFQLKRDERVGKGVKRIVRRQVGNALEGLQKSPDEDETVHEVRKRFKKVRAVLRLVRDEVGEKHYRRENARFRDAGRPLTEIRDARVLLDALDMLTEHFAGQVPAGTFAAVRKGLEANRRVIRHRVLEEEHAPDKITAALQEAETRLKGWSFAHGGWSALACGLKRIYKAGRKDLETASAEPTTENLHEWRKQAKYLWHQLQLLEPAGGAVLEEFTDQVHELTQLLGDDHDLVVLRELVSAKPDHFGGAGVVETLQALIDRRRKELQEEAFGLGQRLCADRPKAFLKRIKGWWKTWRSESSQPKAGLSS